MDFYKLATSFLLQLNYLAKTFTQSLKSVFKRKVSNIFVKQTHVNEDPRRRLRPLGLRHPPDRVVVVAVVVAHVDLDVALGAVGGAVDLKKIREG